MKKLRLEITIHVSDDVAAELEAIIENDDMPRRQWANLTDAIIEHEMALITIEDVVDWELY